MKNLSKKGVLFSAFLDILEQYVLQNIAGQGKHGN
jgi:hypothetical protein